MNDERQIRYFEMQRERAPVRRFWLPLADLYRRRSRLDEARTLLETGLLQHPDSVAGRWVLSQILWELGETAECRRLLDEIVVFDPDHAQAAALLSRCEAAITDKTEAPHEAVGRVPTPPERVAETTPEALPETEPEVHVEVSAEADSPPEIPVAGEAEATAEAVVSELSPAPPAAEPTANRDVFVTRTLADIYLAQGHQDKALNILHQVLSVHPEREDVVDQIAALESAGAGRDKARTLARPEPSPEREKENKRRFEAWLDRERKRNEPA